MAKLSDEERKRILAKIKKLLALKEGAEKIGSEGEAYAAANGVHRLLTEYNLFVDFESSLKMILDTLRYTTEYRIGLMSPTKKDRYDHSQCERFCNKVTELSREYGFTVKWKKSIRDFYEEGLSLMKLMK